MIYDELTPGYEKSIEVIKHPMHFTLSIKSKGLEGYYYYDNRIELELTNEQIKELIAELKNLL